MRRIVLSRLVSALLLAIVVSALSSSADAQQPADSAKRVALVAMITAGSQIDLSEATLREVQATLDTLREGSHIRLVARENVSTLLRQAGFPMALNATNDMRLLGMATSSVATVAISVERVADGYRLSSVIQPSRGGAPVTPLPIVNERLSAIATTFARMIASDSTIRLSR